MIHRQNHMVLKSLPTMRPKTRTVVASVEVSLSPISWTPDLIDQTASILAAALVRDLHERPPKQPKVVS